MKKRKTLRDYISNIPKGIKTAIAAGTLLGMVSFAPLPAVHADEVYSKQNEDGWKVELGIDAVPFILQTQGLEEEMGKSGEIHDEYSFSWDDYHLTINDYYGAELNPIKVDPGAGAKILIKPKASFIHTPSGIGFHLGGWWLSGSDSKKGDVPGYSEKYDYDTDKFTYKFSQGLVSMWDEIFGSYWEEDNWVEDPDYEWFEYYPNKAKTKYEVSRDFKIIDANLSVSIPVVPALSALAGLRGQYFEINDMQRVQPTFHSQENYIYYDGYTEKYIWNNNMDLKVDSSSKSIGIGPMIGLSARKNLTKLLRVYGDISQSWIMMRTERTANFTDIDDITYSYQVYDPEGNLVYDDTWYKEYLEGKFPFSDTQKYTVPVTEINLGLDFLLGKRKNVTLSVGYWKQIMQGVPKPARFHYKKIEDINDLNDLNKFWEYDKTTKTVSSEGFKIGANIRY